MPRYYCDYCDTYLTHDSPVVRKQHNTGYKHKANVRNYYSQFEEAQTQDLIDNKIMEHLAKATAGNPQLGGSISAPPGMRPPGMPAYNPPPGFGPPPGYSAPPPGAMPYRPPSGFPPPVVQPPPYQPPPSQYSYPPPRQ